MATHPFTTEFRRGLRHAGPRARRRSLWSVAGSIALSVVPVVAFLGLNQDPAAASATITGTGSSYAAVAINQWVAQVETLYGDNVNYATSSSVLGLNNFAQYPLVDFGASEIGYSTGQANQEPPSGFSYQYLPDVAGATCLMYNVQDSVGNQVTGLKLTAQVLLGIFTGTIKNWNNSAIAALNPGVLLPSTPIVVVYRTDASGDNYIFSDYLYTLASSAWNAFAAALSSPLGAQAVWPVPQNGARTVGQYDFGNWTGQSGSDNASNYVYGNPGSITYVETAYAILHHDPCAYVQNASGAYVQPSETADAVALESDALQPDLEQNLTPVFESTQPTAYPISAYSYFVMAEQSEIPAAKQAVEGQFVSFVACKGQQSAGALGYSPLPPNLVQADFDAVGRITGTQPPTATASNCANPYVDGSLPLPGEPVIGSAPAAPGSGGASPSGPTGGGAAGGAAGGGAGGAAGGAAASSGGPATVSVGSGSSVAHGQAASAGHQGGTVAGRGATGSSGAANAVGAASGGGAGAAKHRAQIVNAPPPGQVPGLALHNAAADLVGASGPTWTVLLGTLGFLALLMLPPVIAMGRRRTHPTPGDEVDHP